jgi:hypothetical protein
MYFYFYLILLGPYSIQNDRHYTTTCFLYTHVRINFFLLTMADMITSQGTDLSF